MRYHSGSSGTLRPSNLREMVSSDGEFDCGGAGGWPGGGGVAEARGGGGGVAGAGG